jgi:uncharacterized protein YndB with AHSA1/START domain
MNKNQLKVEALGSTLILTRQFDATRRKVFQAYADCKHLMNWWGPREWPLTYCKLDFRIGGKWHFCMTGPGGMEGWGLAIYKDIKEPELIEYEDFFSDKDGNKNKDFPSTVVKTEFFEKDGKTILKSTATYATPEDLKKVSDMGMVEGITQTLDRLEEYLAVDGGK